MHSILPPYGVILRSAMASGDKELMRAFAKYSEWMMSKDLDIHDGDRASWQAAHEALVAAAK